MPVGRARSVEWCESASIRTQSRRRAPTLDLPLVLLPRDPRRCWTPSGPDPSLGSDRRPSPPRLKLSADSRITPSAQVARRSTWPCRPAKFARTVAPSGGASRRFLRCSRQPAPRRPRLLAVMLGTGQRPGREGREGGRGKAVVSPIGIQFRPNPGGPVRALDGSPSLGSRRRCAGVWMRAWFAMLLDGHLNRPTVFPLRTACGAYSAFSLLRVLAPTAR